MNFLQMIESNIVDPLPIDNFYYARKRILHKGYEIFIQSQMGWYVHINYVDELDI